MVTTQSRPATADGVNVIPRVQVGHLGPRCGGWTAADGIHDGIQRGGNFRLVLLSAINNVHRSRAFRSPFLALPAVVRPGHQRAVA